MSNGRIEQLMTRTRRPSSPGQMVAGLLDELGITQTELARRLKVSRATVSSLINGHRSLTPDLADRLGAFFGDGGAVWLRMQQTVDMWDFLHSDHTAAAQVEPYPREALTV